MNIKFFVKDLHYVVMQKKLKKTTNNTIHSLTTYNKNSRIVLKSHCSHRPRGRAQKSINFESYCVGGYVTFSTWKLICDT